MSTTLTTTRRFVQTVAAITVGLASLAPAVAHASPTPPPDGFVNPQAEPDPPVWGPDDFTDVPKPCWVDDTCPPPEPEPCDDMVRSDDLVLADCPGPDRDRDPDPDPDPEDEPEDTPDSSVEDRPIRATPTFTG